MQLNQNYVMSDAAYTESGEKKGVEDIEQLDRELRYMERAIATLKINAIKQHRRDKKEIHKKADENTSLVDELNTIKLEEKALKCEIMKQNQLIEDLEKETSQKRKSLQQDLVTAKSEAAMMLQSHGIDPGSQARLSSGDPQARRGPGIPSGGNEQSKTNFF
jgi:wobble nucleotide-excising tRNase